MKKSVLKRVTALLLALLLCAALLPDFSTDVHAVTQDQKNIAARADWYYGITWVCKQTVTGWGGTFYQGNTYHIPYGQPIYSGKYIGFDVSFEEFLNAAATAGSVFYTERSYYTDDTAPYYTSDCSAFVSWCWNISRTTTHAINSVSTSYGYVTANSAAYTLQLGDALNKAGSHVVIVSDLQYDASGAISKIEITEQTTPQMKRTMYTPTALAQKYGDFTIQRYTGTVPAAPADLPCHGSGQEESWIEKACFDVMVYRDRNTDLADMTDAQLKEHWLTNGIKEGRPSSTILDLKYYLEQNSDLKAAFGTDYTALYNHFITNGYQEHRKSSRLFDGDYYVKYNPDVYEAVGEDYLLHYVETGMKEGRRASKTYSPDYYLSVRPDVAAAWPNDYVMAARHYAGHGINDGTVAYDDKAPVISNAKISNVTAAGYTVTCKVTDNAGVTKVAFPTWTLLNDQDDLPKNWDTTQLGTKSGDTYTFQVKVSEHNNELGMYATHIYAYDAEGNRANLGLDVVEVKDPASADPDPEPTEPEPTEPEPTEPKPTEPEPTEPEPTEPEKPTPEEFLPDVFYPEEDEGPPALWPENPNYDDSTGDDPTPGDPIPEDPEQEDPDQVSPEYKIELRAASDYAVEGTLLKHVKPSTPVRSLLNQFTNKTLKVFDKEGNEISGFQQVGTGDTVNLYVGNQLIKSLTIVVRGDVDGNGKVDTTDYMRVKAAFLSTITLTDAEEAAADVDDNGGIDTTDYMRIKAHFLDMYDLNA